MNGEVLQTVLMLVLLVLLVRNYIALKKHTAAHDEDRAARRGDPTHDEDARPAG